MWAWPWLNVSVGHHKSMASESTFFRWVRLLPVVACLWLLIADFLLLQFWPAIPESKTQWALFIAFGPPLYLLGEFISEKLFSSKRGYGIAPPGFSFTRVFLAFPVALVFLAAVWGTVWLLTQR